MEEAPVDVAEGVVAGALEAGVLPVLPGAVLEAEDRGAELEPALVEDVPAELVAFKQLVSARYGTM